MLNSTVASWLRRARPQRGRLITLAFWALAAITLFDLRELHLWGMPGVQFMGALATMTCCLILVGLVVLRGVGARRGPVWSVSFWLRSVGAPGLFLCAAVASYLAIGAIVLVVEGNWQPDTAGHLRYRLLYFGVLVAAALGGRAVLERTGADRLLRGMLVILTGSCALILASPFLRELDILAIYRHPFRLTGAFTTSSEAGLVGCMAVTLALAIMTNGGSRKLGFGGLAIGTAATLATASRMAFFVLVTVLVWFALLNLRDRRKAVFLLSWAGGLIGVAVVAVQMTPWTDFRDFLNQDIAGPMFCEQPSDGAAGEAHDCAVLLAVKDVLVGAAAGGPALNWRRTLPVQRWQGVTVQGPDGRVIGLNLRGLALSGRIPPELGRLTSLAGLRLGRNRLTGAIPPELGDLTNLRILGLAFNRLTGEIPRELAMLPNLEQLRLRDNRLTGPVPPELGQFGSLALVRLAGNDLEHPFPRALRAVADHDLMLCEPSADDRADALLDCAILLAVKDVLVGAPSGDLALNWSRATPVRRWQGVTVQGPDGRVIGLNLRGLALSGRIPPELGRLTSLAGLRLGRNRLTGAIPPELGDLTNLRILGLAFNRLTGEIPRELAMLPNLEQLWLKGNRLTGPVPPELGQFGSLALVRLAGNDLERPFPRALRGVADHDLVLCEASADDRADAPLDCAILLAVKDVLVGAPSGDSALNWSRATPVRRWQGVTVQGPDDRVVGLNLRSLALSGRIPPELGRLTSLAGLRLGRNRLTGPIPPELGDLTNLRVLGLAFNRLTGEIPRELAMLPNLEQLWLKGNRLTGPVPPELGQFGSLALVRLAGNDLERPFPRALRAVADHDLMLCEPSADDRADALLDCAILLAVKDVLVGAPSGDSALNWSRATPVRRWQGVTVQGPDDRVVGLNLRSLALSGRIPPELGRLTSLAGLRLGRNRLTGPIPPELGDLTNLRILGLAFNRLTGEIPRELAMLPNLEQLWLKGNRLTGPVPPELGQFGSLALVRLAGNDLKRPFPPKLRAVQSHDLGATAQPSPPEMPAVAHPAGDDISGASAMDGSGSNIFLGKIADALANERLLLWRLGFAKAMEAPLFGHGLGALISLESAPSGHYDEPLGVHNLYLALLGEAGILPLSLFLLAVFLLLHSLWLAPKSPSRDAAQGWILVIALHGMTSHHVLLFAAAMFLAGLSAAISATQGQGAVALSAARTQRGLRSAKS